MNSFSKKFIIRSIVVVLGLFLTIYFLFNDVADRFVDNVSENDLRVQIHNNNADTMAFFRGYWAEIPRDEINLNFLELSYDALPHE